MSIPALRTTLIALTSLVAALFASGSSLKAMPVFFDIELTPFAGPRVDAVAFGSFSIDGNLFSETGTETFISTTGLLTFDISFDGFDFDLDYEGTIDGPSVTFTDGIVTDFDYATSLGASPAVIFFDPLNGFFIRIFGDSDITEATFAITRRAIAVAEPASLMIFGVGLLAMAGFGRRFAQS